MGLAASREGEPRHRSLNCRHPSVAEFVNETPLTVCTVWLDYTGGQRRYYTLPPGARVRQPTFTAHPWAFVAIDDPGAVCVVDNQAVWYPPPPPAAQQQQQEGGAGSAVQVARIRLARTLCWSPAQHLLFPSEWHEIAATLMLCHHRLAGQGSGGRPAAPPPQQEQQQDWCVPGLLARLRRLSSGIPPSPRATAATAPASTPAQPAYATHLGHLPKACRAQATVWQGIWSHCLYTSCPPPATLNPCCSR